MYFFQNFRFFSSKNCKKYKKNYHTSKKIKNHLTTTYILIYVFSRKFKFRKIIKKIIFRIFAHSWKVRGTRVTVTVTVIVTVTVTFEVPRWNVGPSTYIETPKKIWGKKVNVKFFTVDPYFGCMFFLGPAKSDKNSTFCHFSTYMGGLMGPKQYWPQSIVGQHHLYQKWWILDPPGLRN